MPAMEDQSDKRRLDDERWRELRAEARIKAPMGEPLPAQPSSDLLSQRLNRVSRQEMLAVEGIGPALADRIIAGRPYRSGRQLLERNIVSQTQYENLKQRLVQADELLSA
jgi:DNA uptake protein ComE-like DNA-binding protein